MVRSFEQPQDRLSSPWSAIEHYTPFKTFKAGPSAYNGRVAGGRRVMIFPITSIAKFLMPLAILTPAVNDSIDKVRHLIDTIRKPGAGTQNQIDDLKKAIELQALVNKEINDKLRLIEKVLQTIQKSLKILAVTGAAVGLIALVALVVAVVK